MSKKLYMLISGIVGGLATIGIAINTFLGGDWMVQINIAIPIVAKAIDEVLFLFVPVEEKK